MPDYDGIIIGAGHNGLILQAYLGKAGLKTLCIERRPVAGGGLSTVEDPRHPGFLHNTHAFFQRAITTMPWYADLALERHGARYIEPELNVALLTGDGRALEWWTDIERTIESFARIQPARCRHLAALAARVRADRAGHPCPREPDRPAAARGTARRAEQERRRPAPAGGQRALAARIRAPGVRASGRAGRAAVLQRTARGRSARTRLRASHRGAAREPRQGADVARRIGGACARAGGRGARKRRRGRPDDRAGAYRGRERPRRRRRDRRGRSHPREAVRRLVAQSDADLHRSAGWRARAARHPRAGRALPVQSAGAAVCAASQSARAAALQGERRSSGACARLHGDHGARSRRPVPRHRAPS